MEPALVTVTRPADPPLAGPPAADEIRRVAGGIARYVLSTTTPDRADRLWPSDYVTLRTNPLNLGYGACGTALFLHDVLGGLPPEVERWILDRRIGADSYPPGLYTGLAGIAYALDRLGHGDRAREVMREAYRSPLLFEDPTHFQGVAGWGWASLLLHRRGLGDELLEWAGRAGDHLLRVAQPEGDGSFWRSTSHEMVPLGFGYGASGIALFLLQLHGATGEDRFLEGATRGMEFEAAHAGADAPGDQLRWGTDVEATGHMPYWLRGTAGVGSALLRFHEHTGDARYLRLAERAFRGSRSLMSVAPHQFFGMSGVGEFYLDLYRATGEEAYRREALHMAHGALHFRIDREAGIAFPGRHLLRISCDFGMGSAGVGAFLHRLADPGPRRLHDPE
ncbi:MAG TPA: lanthionine synthetase C family protein [Longimicrobiaceae bacterium]|jgi:hypothetical protein